MQTTTPTPGLLLVAASLMVIGPGLHAGLTEGRLVPLASDYLQPADASAPIAADDESSAEPVTQLPPVVVSASPLPDLADDQVLTDAGRAFLAEQRYFTGATDTLNRVTLPLFGQSRQTIALARLREDERLADMANLDRQISTLKTNRHTTAADELGELRDAAFVRTSSPF